MNKFESRTLKKKRAIIESAMTLFSKQGFSDVSIKEIAALAEVSQVSIYNYFGSKELLVRECAELLLSDTIEQAENLLASEGDFVQKMEQALALCSTQINRSLSSFLSEKAIQDNQFMVLLIKEMNRLKKELYKTYIACGREAGVIPDTLSDNAIEVFIDALNTIGVSVPETDLETLQKELSQLFLYGLLGK